MSARSASTTRVLTETSIGDLFIAGILPGIMMAILFSATVILKVILRPQLAPPVPVVNQIRAY